MQSHCNTTELTALNWTVENVILRRCFLRTNLIDYVMSFPRRQDCSWVLKRDFKSQKSRASASSLSSGIFKEAGRRCARFWYATDDAKRLRRGNTLARKMEVGKMEVERSCKLIRWESGTSCAADAARVAHQGRTVPSQRRFCCNIRNPYWEAKSGHSTNLDSSCCSSAFRPLLRSILSGSCMLW